MHVLLDPPAPARQETLEVLHRWLAGRLRRWRPARRLLGRELSDGLAAVLAWHLVSRELLPIGGEELALRRGRDELVSTLRDAERGEARSPLAVALAWAIPRYGLSPLALRGRVEALERDAHVRAFASRAEVRACQARTAHPEARVYLALFGLDGEREEFLALALANGIERALSLPRARQLLADHGRLVFSGEELTEAGVSVPDLLADTPTPGTRLLFERAIAEARRELAKGWPLCLELGAWRGRQLAFVLRWFAAELTALEVASARRASRSPRAGFLRLGACTTAALGPRRAPF